jgi:hypothetical protein
VTMTSHSRASQARTDPTRSRGVLYLPNSR